jgi:hypothetical protein
MNNRENLQHKTKEIILFFLVVILLSSLLILLFPAGLAVAGAAAREPGGSLPDYARQDKTDSKLFTRGGASTIYSSAVLSEI